MLRGPKVSFNVARSDRFFWCCKVRSVYVNMYVGISTFDRTLQHQKNQSDLATLKQTFGPRNIGKILREFRWTSQQKNNPVQKNQSSRSA